MTPRVGLRVFFGVYPPAVENWGTVAAVRGDVCDVEVENDRYPTNPVFRDCVFLQTKPGDREPGRGWRYCYPQRVNGHPVVRSEIDSASDNGKAARHARA